MCSLWYKSTEIHPKTKLLDIMCWRSGMPLDSLRSCQSAAAINTVVMRNDRWSCSRVKHFHSPPFSRLLSHSLDVSLHLPLLSHSSSDLHSFAPTFLLSLPPTTFLHPETPSSATKAGKEEGRQSGRKLAADVWDLCVCVCGCVYTPDYDCFSFSFLFSKLTRQRLCDCDQGGPRSRCHGSMRRITVNNVQCYGIPPLSNISESPATHCHQLGQQRHWDTQTQPLWKQWPVGASTWSQSDAEWGWEWQPVAEWEGRKRFMRGRQPEACLGCGLKKRAG